MLIKLIGSLLIALAGMSLAAAYCRFEKKKLNVLDGFISLLFYIKGQIDCYSLPPDKILSSVSEDILQSCNCREKPDSIEQMIKNSKIYLEDESMRLLNAFSAEFGSTYREEQLKRCDYYIQALSEQRRRLSDDLPAKSKIGSALCICSSLGIMIILW